MLIRYTNKEEQRLLELLPREVTGIPQSLRDTLYHMEREGRVEIIFSPDGRDWARAVEEDRGRGPS